MKALDGYRVVAIEVSAYRGIEAVECDVGPGGFIVRGKNTGGKTSMLHAVGAALGGQDVGADAIRLGSDESQIAVTLAGPQHDRLRIERVITPDSTDVSARDADGVRIPKAATLLKDLIGKTPNPLDLLDAPRQARAAWVLAASPAPVSIEFLRRFDPQVPEHTDVRGHGLEAIARLRAWRFEQRAAANARARDTAAVAAAAADRAARLGEATPAGAPTVQHAESAVQIANAALARLEAEVAAAARAHAATESARARIAELREQAKTTRGTIVPVAVTAVVSAEAATHAAELVLADLEKQLAAARLDAATRRREHQALRDQSIRAERLEAEAAGLEREALGIVQTLSAAAPEIPTPLLEQARAAVNAALDRKRQAEDAVAGLAARAEAEGLLAIAAEAKLEAEHLDGLVHALSFDAPAALLKENDGIPGLAIDGDDVTLDGVRLDSLSGAEQVRFAVRVAKRVNAKRQLRLLIVDGLERLDPDALLAFLHEATSDGWQLFASLVDRGDVVIQPLDAAEAA